MFTFGNVFGIFGLFLSLLKKPDDVGVCFLVPGDHSENSSYYLLTSTHPLILLTHILSSYLISYLTAIVQYDREIRKTKKKMELTMLFDLIFCWLEIK